VLFWFWCQSRWAPHVSGDEAAEIVRHVHAGSPKLIADDVLGKALRLSYADRDRLKIRAIGCFDADKALRKKLAKARRRERDRLRAAEKRKANGATPRANSLSQTKPWEEMGSVAAPMSGDRTRQRFEPVTRWDWIIWNPDTPRPLPAPRGARRLGRGCLTQ
jgi:hypothetical protein